MVGNEKLAPSLTETLALESLKDLAGEYAQLDIEEVFNLPVLEHVPVIRTVYGLCRAGASIRDRQFAKKLLRFLSGLADVPAEERRQMVDRLERDPTYGRRVGEHLIDILERLDAHRKPIMVGKVFAAFAQDRISALVLQRLVLAIERLPIAEIASVRPFQQTNWRPPQVDPESMQTLVLAGLGVLGNANIGGRTAYQANDTCKAFIDLDLDRL